MSMTGRAIIAHINQAAAITYQMNNLTVSLHRRYTSENIKAALHLVLRTVSVTRNHLPRFTRSSPAVGRVLSSGGVADPKDAVGALDRFRETSIVDRRVRGVSPPHPLPSGERMPLIFPNEAAAWASGQLAI
jgi:hypothetical protein